MFIDEVLMEVIRKYTKESGVRELERLLSSVVRKIVSKSVINKEKLVIFIDKVTSIRKTKKCQLIQDII